jgi:CheY-like chemotaxis protein
VDAALNEALEGVERIRRMVAELRMQTRATDDAPRAVHLHNVIDAAIELAAPHTRSKAVVDKKLGDLPAVVGSQARLTQLFLNLIVNSAQSIPEGRASENHIELRSARVGGFVEIEIEDTGEGIDPELVEAVSDRDPITSGFGEGTGLGLAMCESIVSELGGRLELRRRTGHNLARVLLPVSETEAPIAAAPDDSEPLSSRPIGPASLLVIDDEPLVARALMRALKPHQVRHARGGREALGLLATGDEYDLILCDVMMPDLSGMDVYDELSRNRPELIGRLVFMTGGAFTDRAEHFRRRISNPFLDKPLDLGKVRDLLARHARRRFAKGDEEDGRR